MNFALRTIDDECIQRNYALGRSYTVYSQATPLFNQMLETEKDRHPRSDQDLECRGELFCFIMDSSGEFLPLFKKERNYIVSEDGRTMDHIRF